MNAAAYLYSLLGNAGVVRRDLPASGPAVSLTVPVDAIEMEAFSQRASAGAKSYAFLKAIQPTSPNKPSLVPSADGPITRMLLTVPKRYTSGEIGAIYEKLFQSLPASTELVCLVNTGSKTAVEAWVKQYGRANATVIEAPDHVGFSIWAQDAYAISETSTGETYFIEPLSFLRYADAVIADYVSGVAGMKTFQAPLYFQGGNILIGDDFWMIGMDYPINSLGYVKGVIHPNPGESAEALVARLYREYLDTNRRLEYVGSSIPVPGEAVLLTKEAGTHFVDMVFQGNKQGTRQPLFHIDMFLTLAGRNAAGKYQILVGDPSLAPAPPSASYQGYAMQAVYDKIAQHLTAQGYAVIRNPLPLTYYSEMRPVADFNVPNDPELFAIYNELTSAGLAQVELRSWYFATANNALVQNDPADKRVWMPTYGHGAHAYLQASDQDNKKIWEALGYQVELLPNFHSLALGLGAVHCIQKYIARG